MLKWFWRMFTIIDDDFIQACRIGDLHRVKILYKRGADIHELDDYALRLAAEHGHLDVVKYLVEHGADIYARRGWALRWAAGNGQLDVVKYLVERGADVHVWRDEAFRWAAWDGHLDVVNFLRKVTGPRYKCHGCLIKSTCLILCKDFRAEEK